MKFKAVEFMREARNKIYKDTKDLSYEKQIEYLERHSKWFAPNKSFLPKEHTEPTGKTHLNR